MQCDPEDQFVDPGPHKALLRCWAVRKLSRLQQARLRTLAASSPIELFLILLSPLAASVICWILEPGSMVSDRKEEPRAKGKDLQQEPPSASEAWPQRLLGWPL